MISTDHQLETTWECIRQFQRMVAQIRASELNPENYRLSAGGFLAEIDRMTLEMREYLWSHPAEARAAVAA